MHVNYFNGDPENGRLAIEEEYALENSPCAWLTASLSDGDIFWTHTQAETDGRTGMAMVIEEKELFQERPEQAPAMHYRVSIQETGRYHVWLLVKFDDHRSDACVLALDGEWRVSERKEKTSMCF